MNDYLSVRPCVFCPMYVASYDGLEVEDACPLVAVSRLLEILAKEMV